MAGLYIHVPFCHSKCIYCDFYSIVDNKLQQDYINGLLKELRLYIQDPFWSTQTFSTLYIGGGTPSILSSKLLTQLIYGIEALVPQKNWKERTLEVNPEDVSIDKIHLWKELGFDRISMGVQSFYDPMLRFLRRIHSARQGEEAVHLLHKSGIHNVSIDLIFSLPEMSMIEWKQNLQRAIDLRCTHISAYGLSYEEGTPLYRMLRKGIIHPVEDDCYIAQYETLIDTLTSHGYIQYELSNFAHEGQYSLHNSSYWERVPYLGLGPSAHGYDGKRRYGNVRNIVEYLKRLKSGKFPIEFEEKLSEVDHYNESIMLGLRTSKGVDLEALFHEFGHQWLQILTRSAKKGIEQGLLKQAGTHLCLTRKALPIADGIISELFYSTENTTW